MNQTPIPTLHILLAEDDIDDAFFLKRALEKAGVNHLLTRAFNGAEVVEKLGKCLPVAGQPQEPMPHLLLLDLKMPGLDGHAVLEWIQRHPSLNTMPVVVLSSSALPADFDRAKALGADGYYVKPFDSSKLQHVVEQLRARQLNPAWKPPSPIRDGKRLSGPAINFDH